jgi:Gram-negative porin
MLWGDNDPQTTGILIGGKILPVGAEDPRDQTITLSRVRSGFIGTQIGFGVGRQISPSVHVDSLLSISMYDISSNRGQSLPKGVDYREAWAAVGTPYGTLKFGRMFSIFGSASAPVLLIAYRYGVGNPCIASQSTIACASVGAGPLYAGFDAQLRYISPRIGGFELQFAVSDPVVGPGYQISPTPRFDGELNFEQSFGQGNRVRVIGQGLTEKVKRVDQMREIDGNVWGGMGAAILEVSGLNVGGGGWAGSGIGTRGILEAEDAANPLGYDVTHGTYELRQFRGFFGNVAFDYHGTALAVGGGTTFVRPTADDADETKMTTSSVLKQQTEYHVVFTQKFDALVFTAEYMHWKSQWHWGEVQNLNFAGVGANFVW